MAANTPASRDGRVPPHDLHAEEAVVGACLLSAEALQRVRAAGLRAQHFYSPTVAAVWEVVESRDDAGEKVDVVLVDGQLPDDRIDDLLRWQTDAPSTGHAVDYAQAVMDCARRRDVISMTSEVAVAAYEGVPLGDALGALADSTIPEIGERKARTLTELLADPEVDVALSPGGLAVLGAGRLSFLTGQKGVGKSMLAQWEAKNLAAAGMGTLWLDAEMVGSDIARRARALSWTEGTDRFSYIAWHDWMHQPGTWRRGLLDSADLVVIDSAGRAGAGDTSDSWIEFFDGPLSEILRSSAVLILDHFRRPRGDEPGHADGSPRGSGRKVADADLVQRVSGHFRRASGGGDATGALTLHLTKDRHARVASINDKEQCGSFVVDHRGGRVNIVRAPAPAEPAGDLAESVLAEKVLAVIDADPGISGSRIATATGLHRGVSDGVIGALEAHGIVLVDRANPRLFRHYRT